MAIKSRQIFASKGQFTGRTLRVVAILLQNPDGHCFGTTEEDLAKLCGLAMRELYTELAVLRDHGFAIHQFSQAGTAGPLAHWWKLTPNVQVCMEHLEPASEHERR